MLTIVLCISKMILYDSVRDITVDKPDRNMDELIYDLGEKDTSLQIKHGTRYIEKHVTTTSRRTYSSPQKLKSKGRVPDAITRTSGYLTIFRMVGIENQNVSKVTMIQRGWY